MASSKINDKLDVESQTVMSSEQIQELSEISKKYAFLVKTSEQKDDLIKLLIKEKNILDGEKILLQKEHQAAVKDKENIVMRFAMVEKNLLDAKNQIENMEKKEKKYLKDTEALNNRIKTLKDEKQNINTLLEMKCQEQKNNVKDIDALKNQISSLETKCKWNSVKLKQEMETKLALEKELQEIKSLEICHKVETQENGQQKIDELKANQITLKHINSEQADKICFLEKQLEVACNEKASFKAQLAVCQGNIAKLESENKKQNETACELQIMLDDHILKVAELQSKSSEFETCRAALSIAQSTNKEHVLHIEQLKKIVDGHSKEIEVLRQSESELLALNEKLSFSNVVLQNEIALHQSKSLAISIENDSVKKSQVEYETNVQKLVTQINLDRKNLAEERLTMAKHVTEKNKECQTLKKQLDQALGDLDAMRKKNILIVKDLQREISTLQKNVKKESVNGENETTSTDDIHHPIFESPAGQKKQCFETDASSQKLIERIIRLQQANNRQAEKIDFLENHSDFLVSEVQKKSKIIQHYMMREQSSSCSSDKNKLYTGIIQTIYGNNKISDMNVDLVLEVNRKLQSVLEETILKNITLKENIDTLGLEIDHLTRQLVSFKKENR